MKKSVSGAGRGRPRQFDRDEALGQALSLFWRYGYGSTSISALTEAMAITAPSLYAAFGSKEQLFYEAVDRYADTHGALLYAPLQGAGSAHDAVHGLLAGAAALFSAKGNPAGCFLMTGTSCSADCAYIEDTLRQRRKEKEQALQACIQQGIQRGELPAGTDAPALAKFFNTVMQGMSMQARDGASRAALEALAATAMLAWPVKVVKVVKVVKAVKAAKKTRPRETQTA